MTARTSSGRLPRVVMPAVALIATLAAACVNDEQSAGPEARTRPDAATAQSAAEMVPIPAGTFVLRRGGDSAGRPAKIEPLAIDRTEVTVAAYRACVDAAVCSPPQSEWKDCNRLDDESRENHPINCVDWTQAARFCRWAGKRLPTEAEWVFAASGGLGAPYPWGDTLLMDRLCWNAGREGTCPVGRFEPGASTFGLLDVVGNVWEWTATAETLPGGVEARVARGGGWAHDPLDPESDVSLLERQTLPPDDAAADLGFRCAAAR